MIYGKPGSLSNLIHPLVRGSLLSIKHLHVTLLHVSQFNGILGLIQFAKKKIPWLCPKGSPRKPIIQTWEVGRRSAHLKLNKAVLHYLEPCPNVVSQCQMRPITGTYNTFIRPTYGTKRWHFETAPLSARSGPRAPTCQPTVAQSIEWVQLWKIQIVNDRMHCVLDIKGPRLFKNIWATIAIEHMGHLRLTSILYGPDKSWH